MKERHVILSERHRVESWLLATCALLVFFIFCVAHVQTLSIVGDTEQYYIHFKEIRERNFPFGLEAVVPGTMLLVSMLDGTFSDFVLLTLLLWAPLIFMLAMNASRRKVNILIFAFLLSVYFFANASFLIRQYVAFAFFIMYMGVGSKSLKILFAVLAIFSHFYAALLIIVVSKRVRGFVFHWVGKLLLSAAIAFFYLVGGIENLIISLQRYAHLFGYEIQRKVDGLVTVMVSATSGEMSIMLVVINVSIFLISLFTPVDRLSSFERRILAVSIFSSSVFLMFSSYPSLANRLGFATYFFSIPFLIFGVSIYARENIRIRHITCR